MLSLNTVPEMVENLRMGEIELNGVQQSVVKQFAYVEAFLVTCLLLLLYGDLLHTNECVFLVGLYFWLTFWVVLSV